MSTWITLTKTDNRPVDVNLDRASTVLRDERNYGTLIVFGPSESVTVLETPDEIFGRAPKREGIRRPATASI
ncbi:MAG: hypothetical protein KGZ73_05460 [Rhizobiales bacterium]|jgi:hypothetical protein|nr:hypothetical protein [Hyphomicrobiales bacterium]